MGLIGGILKLAALLVLALVGLAAFLYFTDYAAEATITEKGSDSGGQYIVIRPKVVPYDYKQHIDSNAAQFVCEGYQVTYRVQTARYQVMDHDGRVVYDSESGLARLPDLVRCSLLPV
ncbi:MAG TPA: hypothetical protein VM582_07340 [Candidatus Thermoplasmatota archaeon]|nr:hypothetical protein [Candidatus Thermoplasmatota archaeon]